MGPEQPPPEHPPQSPFFHLPTQIKYRLKFRRFIAINLMETKINRNSDSRLSAC